MLYFPAWKKVLIALIVAVGAVFALPNILGESTRSSLPSFMPSETIRLGLDLQGGADVLVSAEMEQVYRKKMETLAVDLRTALREAGITKRGTPKVSTEAVTVRIPNDNEIETARRALADLAQPLESGQITGINSTDLDITLDEATNTFRLAMTEPAKVELTDRVIIQSLEVVRRRIDPEGIKEPSITRQGTDRIRIQVPGADSADWILKRIGEPAVLDFYVVNTELGQSDLQAGRTRPGFKILPDAEEPGRLWLVERVPFVTGDQVVDAQPGFDHRDGQPIVSFRFNAAAGKKFGDWTLRNVGNPFAIVVDDKVISAPVIREPILGGAGQISGNFTVESATTLAVQIASGALPANLVEEESRTVGPELGADSIKSGALACVVGFLAVMVFMVVIYGKFGLFANVALVANMILIVGTLSGLGATLTLPGIAGIVLTIGMAVDANVLIFERIREELEAGRKPVRAIETGYEKAFSAIIDANVTTLLAAIVLYVMGSGPVKGFAVTLGIGIVTSVFTAVFLTRLMISLWYGWKRPKTFKVTALEMVKSGTRIGFMRFKRVAAALSIAAVVASMALFAMKGLNYGIDFRGGSMIMTETPARVDPGVYRDALSDLDLGDVAVQEISDPGATLGGEDKGSVVVRIEQHDDGPEAHRESLNEVKAALETNISGLKILATDTVGAKVSGELVTAGIMAVLLAIGGVLVYIWLRFEWQFALGAVVALAHDVALTIGVFSVLSLEFNLSIIAAILTIVGYSLNDTVVVYDRVREKLRKYKKMLLPELIDFALNKTLSRTLMTSITTLLALVALYVLGGPVMAGFTFAMIWGVLVGTYSSVFVAAPILDWLGVKRDWSKPEAEAAGGGVQFGTADSP